MHNKQQLTSYFNGTNPWFDLRFQQTRTQLQQKVRASFLNIKTSASRSNPPFNKKLHNSEASTNNHIAYIAPCHQVIESNLPLEEYARSLSCKQRLRQHELYHCKGMMLLLDTQSFLQKSNIL